jgi:putative ABC transport system ATP-binding protein
MLDDSPSPALQGWHLTRSFGDGETRTTALRDVSLELYGSQVALLMGPSGSGKSTLLAVLSGLLRPDSGQVLALGQDLWALSDPERERFRLRHCGFIFQGYNLFGALTARQQLEMVVRWGEEAHLLPAQMSGGEKQRVAIGRALIKDPDFCFADEPTSALDWAHGEQVIELLRNAAHERGATVLIVAHDSRIIPFVDCVFHLDDGVLREAEEGVPPHHQPSHAGGDNGGHVPPHLLAHTAHEETGP